MVLNFAWLLFFVLFAHSVEGAQWSSSSPPDGLTVYACNGDTVSFDWQYLLNASDVLGDTEWLYDGHSQEVVAITSHGHFFPLATFSQRVEAAGNAGITLKNVVVRDSGNYSVEVHLYADSGASHILLRRYAFLSVSGDLITTDGSLHAIQSSVAVVDPRNGQLAIQLECGTFRFTDQPPFQVEWTTPSGQTVNSTSFDNGHFNLVLGNPVQGGTYRCSIPPQHAHLACLHANHSHQGQASVTVDMVEARLSLLEKENHQLKEQLVSTNSKLSNTETELSNTKNELSNTKNELSNTKNELSHTKTDVSQMNTTVTKLVDAAQHRVAFHAVNILNYDSRSGATTLIFNIVHYNEGNSYDNATGYFTTPTEGVYMFIATAGSGSNSYNERHYLYVDNTELSQAYTYPGSGSYGESSVHAVLHLRAGQRVWVQTSGGYYNNNVASFSGFLVSHDI